jgi:hypothetical protein
MSFIQQYYNSSELSPHNFQILISRGIIQRRVSLLDNGWYKKFPPFHIFKNGNVTHNLISPEVITEAHENYIQVLNGTHYQGYADNYKSVTKTTDSGVQEYRRFYTNQFNVMMNLGNSFISIYILRRLMCIAIPNVQDYGIDCIIVNGLHERFTKNGYNIVLTNTINGITLPQQLTSEFGILGIHDLTAFLNVPMYQSVKQVHIGTKDAYVKSIYANITRNACINKSIDYYRSDAFDWLVRHDREPKWTKRLVPDIDEYNRRKRLTQKWIGKLYQVMYDDMYNYLRYFTPEIVCDGIYVNREIGYMDGSEFNFN